MGFNDWSRDKQLVTIWTVLEILIFVAGIVLIIIAEILRNDGDEGQLNAFTLRRIVWTNLFSSSSVALGVMILLSAAVGLIGFNSGRRNFDEGKGLIFFNATIIGTMIVTIITGSIIWFYTLTERDDYDIVWKATTPNVQIYLQDSLSCCGYWNATRAGGLLESTGFCSNIIDINSVTACINPITSFADTFLNQIFSTIYGFSIIQVFLFLTTTCLIINRSQEERFRRIDGKRGSRFV